MLTISFAFYNAYFLIQDSFAFCSLLRICNWTMFFASWEGPSHYWEYTGYNYKKIRNDSCKATEYSELYENIQSHAIWMNEASGA